MARDSREGDNFNFTVNFWEGLIKEFGERGCEGTDGRELKVVD